MVHLYLLFFYYSIDCEKYSWFQNLTMIQIMLPAHIRRPFLKITRTHFYLSLQDRTPYLEEQFFRPLRSWTHQYRDDGALVFTIEKEKHNEWWQTLFVSTDHNLHDKNDSNPMESLLHATLILQRTVVSWILRFEMVCSCAKLRSSGEILEDFPIVLDIQYLVAGVTLLRLITAVKHLTSYSNTNGYIFQCFAEKSRKDLRELLSYVQLNKIPSFLVDAFHSVNIQPQEHDLLDFPLPNLMASTGSDLNPSLFYNQDDQMIIERFRDVTKNQEDLQSLETPTHQKFDLKGLGSGSSMPDAVSFEPRIEIDLPSDSFNISSTETTGQTRPRDPQSDPKIVQKKLQNNLEKFNTKVSIDTINTSKLEMKPAYDTDSSSLVASVQRQDPEMIRQQMEGTNLSDLYNAERTLRRHAESSKIPDVVIHQPKRTGRWTYQKLAECRAMQKMMMIVSGSLRNLMVQLHDNVESPVKFQILCLIDDSYSMTFFEHQMKETIVLLIEVLRHLECPFAIGRFAGKKVANLLKGFDTPFNMNLGEQILESLNCRGKGTCPGDAFKSFLEELWSENSDTEPTQRIVLMITDGLTTQVDATVYSELCNQYHVTLRTIVLWDASRPRSIGREEILFHNSLSAAGSDQIEVRIVEIFTQAEDHDSEALSYVLAEILENFFTHLRDQTSSSPSSIISGYSYQLNETISLIETSPLLDMVTLHRNCDLDIKSMIQQSAATSMTSFYLVSPPQQLIPGLSALPDIVTDRDLIERSMKISLTKQNLSTVIDATFLKHAEQMDYAESLWSKTEHHMSSEITRFVQVLEEYVFPYNKYTRRKGDFRGTTLYVPGLIRAIATDFTYKKYFGSLRAGGKRQYNVVIAVDCSLSMRSFTSDCVLLSVFLFVAALKRTGIPFFVITFGEKVQLLKDCQSEWTSVHSWILLSQLQFEDNSSMDADAINFGVDLLTSESGSRKLFILSDGYGTSGKRLPAALRRAQMENVEVVAIAVGMDRFGVSHCYNIWAECALPRYLPETLEALYRAEEQALQVTNEGVKWFEFYLAVGTNMSIKEILAQKDFAFSQDLNHERSTEVKIENTVDFSVDICFVVDLTWSMRPYRVVTLQQVSEIITGIDIAARQKSPDIEVTLRVGFVGYHDQKGSDYKESTLPFTRNKTKAIQFISAQLNAMMNDTNGVMMGGDLAEDVNGGLAAALKLSWKSSSRALILITDAPGHGAEMNDGLIEDFDPSAVGPEAHIKEMIEKEIHFFFCRINETATLPMEKAFAKYYNNGDDRRLEIAPLIRNVTLPPEVVYILCLDESTSMRTWFSSSSPFSFLQKSYRKFLHKLREHDQGTNKRIAIINFSSKARWVCGPEPVTINRAPNDLTSTGKGTDFYEPLNFLGNVLAHPSCSHSKFVVIFMTDGRGKDPGDIVLNYARRYPQRYVMHSVGFGTQVDASVLRALTAGGGRYFETLDGDQLIQAFQNIAADSNTTVAFPESIVNHIMDKAISKLILDYL